MIRRLSLRLRIFLFFALLALGAAAIVALSAYLGYARSGEHGVKAGFTVAALVSVFGICGLVVGVWLLFDEHVARPINRLAASLRSGAHAGAAGELDPAVARYLGDLAPAVQAATRKLSDSTLSAAAAVASETARLRQDHERLAALLSEIPLAMAIMTPQHQIVLYDGQAADLLSRVAPARINVPIFEYVEREGLMAAYHELGKGAAEEVAFTARLAGLGEAHEARLKDLGASGYLLLLETATSAAGQEGTPTPRLTFDFALLDQPTHGQPLAAFTVFDTETTGLNPETDRVIQIGAVRVVNGRRVPGERFDMLVAPGRAIPAASTAIHGITDAMVADAASFAEAARAFHRFVGDSVIVAHNAAFDMAFLRRCGARHGVAWDHSVLDTGDLSIALFDGGEDHTLDGICQRLGVTIPEDLRHTALGDAEATAEALCRMLPMIEAREDLSLSAIIQTDADRKRSRISYRRGRE